MTTPKLPDWRDNQAVKAAQQRTFDVGQRCKPAEQSIREALRELRAAEQHRIEAEVRFTKGAATPLDLMAARQDEKTARAKADEAQQAAEGVYAELAEAQAEQTSAERLAKQAVLTELKQAYMQALDYFDNAIEAAVESQERLNATWTVIASQFPETSGRDGLLPVLWGTNLLTSANLEGWRKRRADAGQEPAKVKMLRLKDSIASMVNA